MKINCVIIDDEAENLKYLQQIIEDIDNVEVIKSYTSGESFLEEAPNLKFDICVLDNRLPNITGIECAKKLRGKKIIFVSAHEVSAHDAFDIKAIDVLKKPVIKDRLENAIRKARNLILNEKG
ncbi:MAG: response regulator, partial [Bacteroidetes bacterium]|nr:response regulator [Bacteroidota bacterium]